MIRVEASEGEENSYYIVGREERGREQEELGSHGYRATDVLSEEPIAWQQADIWVVVRQFAAHYSFQTNIGGTPIGNNDDTPKLRK